MFEKESGSPVRLRTCDPLVNRPEISDLLSWLALNRGRTSEAGRRLFEAPDSSLCRAHQLCVSVHISAAAAGNAGAKCCSCRRSCAWACKRSSLVCVCSVREIAVSSALVGFVDCGPYRASGEELCAEPLQFGVEQSILPSIGV